MVFSDCECDYMVNLLMLSPDFGTLVHTHLSQWGPMMKTTLGFDTYEVN